MFQTFLYALSKSLGLDKATKVARKHELSVYQILLNIFTLIMKTGENKETSFLYTLIYTAQNVSLSEITDFYPTQKALNQDRSSKAQGHSNKFDFHPPKQAVYIWPRFNSSFNSKALWHQTNNVSQYTATGAVTPVPWMVFVFGLEASDFRSLWDYFTFSDKEV